MKCDKSLKRTICKYYAFFADAPMIVNIESCEKAIMSVEQPTFKNPNDNVALLNFKQPIDYSQFNIPQEEDDEIIEDEEKVFVDLSQQTEEKETSIMDLLLEGENENVKTKKTKTTNRRSN